MITEVRAPDGGKKRVMIYAGMTVQNLKDHICRTQQRNEDSFYLTTDASEEEENPDSRVSPSKIYRIREI